MIELILAVTSATQPVMACDANRLEASTLVQLMDQREDREDVSQYYRIAAIPHLLTNAGPAIHMAGPCIASLIYYSPGIAGDYSGEIYKVERTDTGEFRLKKQNKVLYDAFFNGKRNDCLRPVSNSWRNRGLSSLDAVKSTVIGVYRYAIMSRKIKSGDIYGIFASLTGKRSPVLLIQYSRAIVGNITSFQHIHGQCDDLGTLERDSTGIIARDFWVCPANNTPTP